MENGQERELGARTAARLEHDIARVREQARRAVEDFKAGFGPPDEAQIERLLYPQLSEFAFELGGRRFVLRELPALAEKKFLRLVEQRLPGLLAELLSFDERLGDDPAKAFAHLLTRAGTAMDLVTEACMLVLDPSDEAGLTREFVQQHAATARQLRILQAQALLNGGRDFLLRVFPSLWDEEQAKAAAAPATPGSPRPSVGSNTFAIHPMPSHSDLPSDNWP